MHGPNTPAPGPPRAAELHYRDQPEDEADASEEAALSAEDDLDVTADEDCGSDPYNRTGRFKRNVR